MSIDVVLLAAIAENGVIGRANTLPWRLKSDMQHFRAATMGKPVVMGRKTYQSIGKPLTSRTTIVVSRDPKFAAPGVLVAPSLTAALAAARGDALRRGCGAIIIAGGGDIYAQALPVATQLSITEVHKRVQGDAQFPAIDPKLWREIARTEHSPAADDEVSFALVTYERINAAQMNQTGVA
ncbi:MAG TPA: dihydrofolate reductase [Xanthobacteraceae bacterium]|nr:dihydrofolate reductase [Xanthobacteraceae bacterium]